MPNLSNIRLSAAAALVLGAAVAGGIGGLGGCDDDSKQPMVMQPKPADPGAERERPTTRVSTPPTTVAATQPADEPVEEEERAPSFITISDADGDTTLEFPPARLWLKPAIKMDGAAGLGRVRALLFSDDPAEAVEDGEDQRSFYLEMELELPADEGGELAERLAAGGTVSPQDLTYAEWVFRSDATERSKAPSGIFLPALPGDDGQRKLQPTEVLVTFNPIGDGFVEVYLVGDFAEFARDGLPTTVRRSVRVRAVLTAETVER